MTIFSFVLLFIQQYHIKISESDLEIERKWLIDSENIHYNLSKARKYEIIQTYISFSPEIRVRKINGNDHVLTVKGKLLQNGLVRKENEYDISENEYNELLKKQSGNTIYKTRYVVTDENGIDLQIDIFKQELEGLAYMEIEFDSVKMADKYKTPNWVIKDVTSDVEYKNGHLARYGIPESFLDYVKQYEINNKK